MNIAMDNSPLRDYAMPGVMTDPGGQAPLLDGLPRDVASLVQVIQGLAVHVFWAERYGLSLSDERKSEVNLRGVRDKLARLQELDERPLIQARPLERKLVCNCRDCCALRATFLMHLGVPDRAR